MCEGIYKKFIEVVDPFIKENAKNYSAGTPPGSYASEFAVYSENQDVLEFENIGNEVPHLYLIDSHIVHLWVQAGAGVLTRYQIL